MLEAYATAANHGEWWGSSLVKNIKVGHCHGDVCTDGNLTPTGDRYIQIENLPTRP